MKLRVVLQLPDGGTQDVTLSCDVTATVADLARTLIRAGLAFDPVLTRIAQERLRPVTIRGRSTTAAAPVLLDPGASIAASGLQSGWTVEAIAEFGESGGAGIGVAKRLVEPAGYLEVVTGEQAGALYSLIPGANLVGRDTAARVYLGDRSVSRRHAVLEIHGASEAVLRDLGSANGTSVAGAGGEDNGGHGEIECDTPGIMLRGPTEIVVGEVTLRFTPGPPTPATSRRAMSHRTLHTRSPRVEHTFARSTRDLPAPPPAATPARVPLLALMAPLIMGGVLFVVTQSPMSLMMMAFSPAMMVGSWLDTRSKARRRRRSEGNAFGEAIAAERAELEVLLEQEIAVRGAETPSLPEIADAIVERSGLLWARRPEHRAFLQVRFGEGTLPSRTSLELPPRGDSEAAQWQAVRELAAEFQVAPNVPVLEQLDLCGAIGVSGEPLFAAGLARSLVLQLTGLHSPEELVLTCFAGQADAAHWEWLKWLPHVAPATSPVAAWQLADDGASTLRLLIALESLIEQRAAASAQLPAVVVLVLAGPDAGDPAVLTRFIALAEAGPSVGVHVIWVAQHQGDLPAACRTFAVVEDAAGTVGFVRSGTRVPLTRLEYVDASTAVQLARALAPVEDAAARALDESDLPKQVALRDVHPVDFIAGAAPIRHAWHSTLASHWSRGVERPPVSLAAPVGQGPDGPTTIDLRLHGPHALVGGTTGAGKSEFLQSWIMSLAATVSPDRLTFLLVDYKGGAAFAECVELPHTVGLVTDLSPHLVRRALTSLRAELRYREELLAEHGAKDLITMERRSDPAAPPTLVIVVDEFAALASEMPEFVDGVVDVAQRGRSLGLHLILATQRPAGVITDNLRANTNLRMALRMADEADSSDVIGVKDAAFFDPETPGRGAIKVGPGRLTHFQTGYLGGRTGPDPELASRDAALELRMLGFAEGDPLLIAPDRAAPQHKSVSGVELGKTARAAMRRVHHPRDIERLRDGIIEAARLEGVAAPRKPWLDVLPEYLELEVCAAHFAVAFPAGSGADTVTVGLQDVPEQQAQVPVIVDLEQAGNIALIGASGTGKTSALITIAVALSASAAACPVELYVIDAGGGALDALRPLPTVGAVAALSDTELTDRVLRRVSEALGERAARYAAARCGGLAAYRGTSEEAGREPRIVLLIDGFAAFRQASEAPQGPAAQMQQLTEIMSTGRAAGVHVVLTSDRPGAIPAALAASVQEQYVLRLANPGDCGYVGVAADALADAPPGRAVLVGGAKRRSAGGRSRAAGSAHRPGRTSSGHGAGAVNQLQFALAGGEPELQAQALAVEVVAARLCAQGITRAPEVRKAPERVALSELPLEVAHRPVYGINTANFDSVTLPIQGLGVVAGPAGSGLTTAIETCAAAAERWANGQGQLSERVLLTLAANGLRQRQGWQRVAYGEDEVRDLARELTVSLGGKPPRSAFTMASPTGGIGGGAAEQSPGSAQHGVIAPGSGAWVSRGGSNSQDDASRVTPHLVIVIERPAAAEGTEALPELVALVKTARRAEVLVLVEFEQGTGGAIWDLFSALKQPTWGLALQPDEGESQSPFREPMGRVKRANFPPGRGFAIEAGRVTPIHVAVVSTVSRGRP